MKDWCSIRGEVELNSMLIFHWMRNLVPRHKSIPFMDVNRGERDRGDMSPPPPTYSQGEEVISNVPAPRFWGCMIIHWNEDLFFHVSSPALCGPICLIVIEVGDVRGYPYPVFGKLTQKCWRRLKSVGAFSGLARLSRLAADQYKNYVSPPPPPPPPPPWSGSDWQPWYHLLFVLYNTSCTLDES